MAFGMRLYDVELMSWEKTRRRDSSMLRNVMSRQVYRTILHGMTDVLDFHIISTQSMHLMLHINISFLGEYCLNSR